MKISIEPLIQRVEPHYFGNSEKQLLGMYHPPRGRARSHGVVLCYPAPQEYMRTHMAFRKLASILAREGFHVLRFDYFGTGDSAGGPRDGSLEQWRQDIMVAADDLKDRSGVATVSLVGLRLGAALAALTPVSARDLVLWEPVVDGKAYLRELRRIHEHKFSILQYPPRLPAKGSVGELLGFVLPPDMQAAVEGIDLLNGISCRSQRMALVTAEERPEYTRLQARMLDTASSKGTAAFEYHHVPNESSQGDEAMLLSTQVLHSIAAILSRRAS